MLILLYENLQDLFRLSRICFSHDSSDLNLFGCCSSWFLRDSIRRGQSFQSSKSLRVSLVVLVLVIYALGPFICVQDTTVYLRSLLAFSGYTNPFAMKLLLSLVMALNILLQPLRFRKSVSLKLFVVFLFKASIIYFSSSFISLNSIS